MIELNCTIPEPFLQSLTRWQLDELNKRVNHIRYAKYPKFKRQPRTNGFSRAFTKLEKESFLSLVKKKKFLLAFRFGFELGLRGSEIANVSLVDFQKTNKTLCVRNCKNNNIDFLPVSDSLSKFIEEFVSENLTKIREHSGFLIYSENPAAEHNHVSVVSLQNFFREQRNKAGLNETYGKTLNPKTGGKRGLYRLTLHSLRHTAITDFYNKCRDWKLTQLFARHQSFQTTMDIYVHGDLNRVREVINL